MTSRGGSHRVASVMRRLFLLPLLGVPFGWAKPVPVNPARFRRGVRVQGLGGLLVRYAQCCQPVPGDAVVGYVTQGRGISIHLTDADQVRAAFDVAREHSRSVIVESFITGEDHRMLVINGELVAVALRVPGHVVGDGVHTIEQLVDEGNRDPRRVERLEREELVPRRDEGLVAERGRVVHAVDGDRHLLACRAVVGEDGKAVSVSGAFAQVLHCRVVDRIVPVAV